MRSLFILLFIIGSCAAFSQSIAPRDNTSNELIREHIFVQTNSTLLITGETLLFRVFCHLGNNTPSFLSRLAYVEIIDEAGLSVLKTKILLENGAGHGDFFIPS